MLTEGVHVATVRRRSGLVVVSVVTALILAACAPAATGAASRSQAPAGTGALSFSGSTLAGGDLDVSTLDGQAVVLWFWAPWCTICRAEAPGIARVADELDGRVTILGIPGLGRTADMREFVDVTGTSGLQHVIDVDGSLWARFGIIGQPSFVFVAPDGSARLFGGALGEDALREAAVQIGAST